MKNIQDIKIGDILINTNTTTEVKVINIEKYGFEAIELGNCQGPYEIQENKKYSEASIKAGAWIKK